MIMSLDDIKKISLEADMIVCGYAFHKNTDSSIQVIQLQSPYHALILSGDDEVLETTMNDIELDIVKGYWEKNKKYMEESYAEIL